MQTENKCKKACNGRSAVALYHGPLPHGLYLDGCCAFDEWLFVQRERFHLQALDVLEELRRGWRRLSPVAAL